MLEVYLDHVTASEYVINRFVMSLILLYNSSEISYVRFYLDASFNAASSRGLLGLNFLLEKATAVQMMAKTVSDHFASELPLKGRTNAAPSLILTLATYLLEPGKSPETTVACWDSV